MAKICNVLHSIQSDFARVNEFDIDNEADAFFFRSLTVLANEIDKINNRKIKIRQCSICKTTCIEIHHKYCHNCGSKCERGDINYG